MPVTIDGAGEIGGLSAFQQGAGLTLIAVQAFTAASSVSVDDCFTSEYDNYRILILPTAVSANDTSGYIRLRSAGVDNSTASSYITQLNGAYSGTQEAATSTTDRWNCVYLDALHPEFCISDTELFRPNVAVKTSGRINRPTRTNAGNFYAHFYTALHTQAVSYDGFSVILNTGNFTGTLRVYGYTNGA